jgi:hypothetical protein
VANRLFLAEATISKIQQSMEAVFSDFLALLVFFGLPESKAKLIDPETFFKTLKEFCASYEASQKKVEQQSQAQQKSDAKAASLASSGAPPTKSYESIAITQILMTCSANQAKDLEMVGQIPWPLWQMQSGLEVSP